MVSQQHVDRILSVANAPQPRQVGDNTSIIHRSWHRCVNQHRLDPTRRGQHRVESQDRLRESRGQIEEYLHVARAGMEQLFKRVSDLGYVLLLTDAQGITVDYIGNDSWDRELRGAGLHLGANWQEEYAGTNGIGTCIVEQLPLTCHRDEHFFSTNVRLSCTTTPLFDPDGDFMGALDVSALSTAEEKESQHLALHLTSLYGQMIEDANFLRHFRDRWILRLGTAGPLVDVCGELMLAFDNDGVVVGANTGARKRLCRELGDATVNGRRASGTPLGRSLDQIFRCKLDDIWRLTRSTHLLDRTLLSTLDHQVFHASITQPRAIAGSLQSTRGEALETSARTQDFSALDRLAGDDRHMWRVLDQARRLVDKQVNILIQGETGTGKELFARALHQCSKRTAKPFVAVNCASIPESLIESELFGYTAGTFTGARSKGMKGLIQQSDGGTLFLDEIGDMPLQLQTRLLRVLSEREVLPLGADRPIHVALTVVAASHRDLRKQIAAGTFREDLYYRLCGATLALPPLRERQDREYIIHRLLGEEAAQLGVEARIEPDAMAVLLRYDWPGNVRQLRNAIRFALAISDGAGVHAEHLPQEVIEPQGYSDAGPVFPTSRDRQALPAPAGDTVPEPGRGRADSEVLRSVLRRHRWNITAVAHELGLCRTTVYRQMRRFGIVPPTHQ
jgi:transcriptional regulator of acetoin/glycerol metabolism